VKSDEGYQRIPDGIDEADRNNRRGRLQNDSATRSLVVANIVQRPALLNQEAIYRNDYWLSRRRSDMRGERLQRNREQRETQNSKNRNAGTETFLSPSQKPKVHHHLRVPSLSLTLLAETAAARRCSIPPAHAISSIEVGAAPNAFGLSGARSRPL
jgi:hypothetical protein